MSVRAYKLIEIKTEEKPTFGLDTLEDNNFLDAYGENLEMFGENGFIDFNRETLENICIDGEISVHDKKMARAILEDFQAGDDNITYFCY